MNSEPIFISARAHRPCSLHTSTRTEHAVSGLNEGSYPRIPPFRLIFPLQGSVILIETDLIIGRCVSADESPPSLLLAGHNCEENELFKSKQEALIYLQRNPPELCWRLRALPFSINKNSHANESPKKPEFNYISCSPLSVLSIHSCPFVSNWDLDMEMMPGGGLGGEGVHAEGMALISHPPSCSTAGRKPGSEKYRSSHWLLLLIHFDSAA